MIARSLAAIHFHDMARLTGVRAAQDDISARLIAPGARLILEMGHGQESDVRRILTTGAAGWRYMHSVRDHLNLVRCVVFEYCGETVCSVDTM